MSTKKNMPKPSPSRKKDGKYVILMETNGEESESWYYFIRLNGNEESLKHLNKQLEQVDWVILDDLSRPCTFRLLFALKQGVPNHDQMYLIHPK